MLSVKTTLKEIPVEIDGVAYTLREMTGKQRDAYMNFMGKRTKFVAGQAQGLNDYEGLQSNLLAMCLFDNANTAVPETTIQSWPASTITTLWEAAQDLNGLSGGALEEAKNA